MRQHLAAFLGLGLVLVAGCGPSQEGARIVRHEQAAGRRLVALAPQIRELSEPLAQEVLGIGEFVAEASGTLIATDYAAQAPYAPEVPTFDVERAFAAIREANAAAERRTQFLSNLSTLPVVGGWIAAAGTAATIGLGLWRKIRTLRGAVEHMTAAVGEVRREAPDAFAAYKDASDKLLGRRNPINATIEAAAARVVHAAPPTPPTAEG